VARAKAAARCAGQAAGTELRTPAAQAVTVDELRSVTAAARRRLPARRRRRAAGRRSESVKQAQAQLARSVEVPCSLCRVDADDRA
jgi:hypothetical protein